MPSWCRLCLKALNILMTFPSSVAAAIQSVPRTMTVEIRVTAEDGSANSTVFT